MFDRALSCLLWASLPAAVVLLLVDADPVLSFGAIWISLFAFMGRRRRGETMRTLTVLALAVGTLLCMQGTGGPESPLFVLLAFVGILGASVLTPPTHLVVLAGISLLHTVLALAMPAAPVLLPMQLSLLALTGLSVNHFATRSHERELELQGQAVRDPSTGLLMPAFFHARLVTLMEARRSTQGTISVLVLDVGEEHDENRLAAAAEAIAEHVRGPDFVGRVGATSFAVALAGVEPGVAVKVAARLTRAVRERCGLDTYTGIAHVDCEHVTGESVECARTLFARAEAAAA